MGDHTTEERRKFLLSKIEKFRLFDDDFMSKVFEDDTEATEFLLRAILQRDDLEVIDLFGNRTGAEKKSHKWYDFFSHFKVACSETEVSEQV